MNRTALIGASSFIGHELISLNPDFFIPTYFKNQIKNGIKFDICNDKISNKIDINDFETIVILSAISNPKHCEVDEYNSYNINVIFMKKLIDDLVLHKKRIIFFSTEYIYSGTKGNYKEKDEIKPINNYGKQKYEIENYIIKNSKNFCILRLAKTYSFSKSGKDFHSQWYNYFINNQLKEVECFSDQVFSPISTFEISKALNFLINNNINGLYNLAGSKSYTRLECLKLFLKKFNLNDINVIANSINSELLGFEMPRNVSMDISKITNLGIDLKSYEENLYEL